MNLYTMNDVQVGGMGVDLKGFSDYVEDASLDPIGRVLGLGDYTDSLSPSNRAAIKAAEISGNWYDVGQQMLHDAAQVHVSEFLEAVSSLRGAKKVDGMLKGHHFFSYDRPFGNYAQREIRTTDMDIAEALGAPYLDDPSDKKQMTMFTYRFPKRKVLRVLAMHGEGSGASLASPLSKLEKLRANFQADIYMTAHHHKLFATRTVLLREDPSSPTKLQSQDALMVACGSWMRGYVENEATYAEAGIMAPLALGAPVLNIKSTPKGFKLKGTI